MGRLDGFATELYVKLYRKVGRAVDSLPYTPELDWLAREVQAVTGEPVTACEVFRNLVSLRKKGLLELKGKSGPRPHNLTDLDIGIIAESYQSQPVVADNLPYTNEFEEMFAGFHSRSMVTMDRALFFCAVLGLRKSNRLPRKKRMTTGEAARA